MPTEWHKRWNFVVLMVNVRFFFFLFLSFFLSFFFFWDSSSWARWTTRLQGINSGNKMRCLYFATSYVSIYIFFLTLRLRVLFINGGNRRVKIKFAWGEISPVTELEGLTGRWQLPLPNLNDSAENMKRVGYKWHDTPYIYIYIFYHLLWCRSNFYIEMEKK